jgi:hypothetical protein
MIPLSVWLLLFGLVLMFIAFGIRAGTVAG